MSYKLYVSVDDVQEQITSFTVPPACPVACEEEMSMEMVDTQTFLSPPLTPTLLPATISSSSPSLLISDKQPTSLPLSNSVSSFTQLVVSQAVFLLTL